MTRAKAFILLLILIGCTSRSPKLDLSVAQSRTPSSANSIEDVYQNLGYGLMPEVPATCKFTCDELELWAGVRRARPGEEALAAHPQTIQELLGIIKERRPEFLSHQTFAYKSFSLHGATFANPRAVVYGCDAKTILTFNGQPSQKGYERLEFSCFNDAKKAFEFKEITFPKEASKEADLNDLNPQERKLSAVLSVGGRGDQKCIQCHGNPARPIWEAYDLWPRFYQGLDDNLSRTASPEYVKWEESKLKEFTSYNRYAGRYGKLPVTVLATTDDRPNDYLGIRLYYLNGERIVSELKNRGNSFEQVKYRFAHALYCSQENSIGNDYLSEKTGRRAKEILMENYNVTANKMRFFSEISGIPNLFNDQRAKIDFDKRFTRFYPARKYLYWDSSEDAEDFERAVNGTIPAAIERVVAPLGFDIQNWSLNMNGGYSYSSGQSTFFVAEMQSMLEVPFLKKFLLSDVEVANLILRFRSQPTSRELPDGHLIWGEPDGEDRAPLHEAAWKELCETLSAKARVR